VKQDGTRRTIGLASRLVYSMYVYLRGLVTLSVPYGFKLLLVPQTKTVQAMPVAANDDILRVATEKLKRLTDETQEQYEAFIDATELYKKGGVNQKDFLSKLSDYLIGMTSLNFIAIQVLLEVKSAIQTNLSQRQSNVPPLFKTRQEAEGEGAGIVGVRKANGIFIDTTQTTQQEKPAKFKNCIVCGSTISAQAKFCNKCGNSQ